MNWIIDRYKIYYYLFAIALSIQCYFGFIAEDILPFLQGSRSLIYFVTDVVFIWIGLTSIRYKKDAIMVISLMAIILISTISNQIPLLMTLNGLRDFIPFFAILPFLKYMLFDNLERRRFFVDKFDSLIYCFLIIQIPITIFQFFCYGAGDRVGGSLGNYHSGIVSTLIFLLTFYLFQKKVKGDFSWANISKYWYYFLLLMPTFLNETKASFIFLFFFLLCMIKVDVKFLFKILLPILIFIILSPLLMNIYLSVTGVSSKVFTIDYYLSEYLFDDEIIDVAINIIDSGALEENKDLDVPRFTKLIEGYKILCSENKLLFGEGIGLFKGGTVMDELPFTKDNKWLIYGSVIYLFAVFIQLGLFGVLWILYFIKDNLFFGPSCNNNLTLFVLLIFLFILIYNDSLRFSYFSTFFFYLLLISSNFSDDDQSDIVNNYTNLQC